MKICPNCHSEVEDHYDLCWKCNYSFEEQMVVEIRGERETGITCLRCGVPMLNAGNYDIREGTFVGTLKSFDLYLCPDCGKVEFYLPQEKLERYRKTDGGLTGRF